MINRRDFLLSCFAITALPYTNFALPPQATPLRVKAKPNVLVNFDGMIALAMGNVTRVSAGILNAHHHNPQLTITQINGEQRTILTQWQAEDLKGSLSIDLETPSRAVERCRTYRYQAPQLRGDANDLAWGIDFAALYPKFQPLHIKEEGLWSKIHFNTGMFFVSKLSEKRWRFFSQNGSKEMPFNRQIGRIGVQIEMDKGEVLAITGSKQAVRLAVDEDVRYEIDITNLPPEKLANIEHFLMYYDILVEQLPRYVPVMASSIVVGKAPEICAPVLFNQTTLIIP